MRITATTTFSFNGEDIINRLMADVGILPENVTHIRLDIKESGHPDSGDYKQVLIKETPIRFFFERQQP